MKFDYKQLVATLEGMRQKHLKLLERRAKVKAKREAAERSQHETATKAEENTDPETPTST